MDRDNIYKELSYRISGAAVFYFVGNKHYVRNKHYVGNEHYVGNKHYVGYKHHSLLHSYENGLTNNGNMIQ